MGGNDSKPQTYTIYICGAVVSEGYYEVTEGETYFDAIRKAGLLPQTCVPSNQSSLIDGKQNIIVVNYVENGIEHSCHDANDPFFALRRPMGNLSCEIVNKLADYSEEYGIIHNKETLRAILGEEDYENNHYKLFIAEADYEKAN